MKVCVSPSNSTFQINISYNQLNKCNGWTHLNMLSFLGYEEGVGGAQGEDKE